MAEVDLGKYLNPEVVSTIDRLDLQAQSIVEGFFVGRHRSPFQGFSSTFSEHRRYNHGDPVKDIDWNVYAKTERHFIKKYEAETDLNCYICVDISSSMAYKSDGSELSKLDYASLVAAAIAYLLIKQQDNVGLITFDNELCHYMRPKSKTSHLFDILTTLSKVKATSKTQFSTSIPKALKLMKQKGLVIFVSDMLGDTDSAIQTLQMLRCKKHDVIAFQILDRAEMELPFSSMGNFVDVENESLNIRAKAKDIRQIYEDEI